MYHPQYIHLKTDNHNYMKYLGGGLDHAGSLLLLGKMITFFHMCLHIILYILFTVHTFAKNDYIVNYMVFNWVWKHHLDTYLTTASNTLHPFFFGVGIFQSLFSSLMKIVGLLWWFFHISSRFSLVSIGSVTLMITSSALKFWDSETLRSRPRFKPFWKFKQPQI